MVDMSIEEGRPAVAEVARHAPTAQQLATWRAFIETTELLRSRLGARLQSESGMSLQDYSVLLALREAPARNLRSSELADAVGWERSRLSHHVGRMERRGLVERKGPADGGWGSCVHLTDAGADVFRRASVGHLQAVSELFIDALSPAQLDAAGEIAQALSARLADTGGPRR
ncbi:MULTISPECIES: MarR family winged helix-turn-helix transcriptional regulator [unclassified Isoptericola]|uniref:MarR family winged helix-turn-helix transcriptional regulator n=1 Tax=unclassified Isoptericola TaxID=2623355 RepID=UPI0027133FF1|nr:MULTISPECIES: MarR family transcriptional regulator [unclassified Isoptericola]MDO8147718.1 MarR family transcriptional regulator [Isoptericola sp. b515]MDO8149980.1 MarR family transcriptional regulator [Isoptericola sp. b408]